MSTIRLTTMKVRPETLARLKKLADSRGQFICRMLDEIVAREVAKDPILESGK